MRFVAMLRRVSPAVRYLWHGEMPGFVRTDVVRHASERPYLSTLEARDWLRSLGIDCSREDVCKWAQSGCIEAYKYRGRWRILSLYSVVNK